MGSRGFFFVEPLFAARFGLRYLVIIVNLIRAAGHEIQLHLHPEWTDEALQPIIENCKTKRQHLSYYTLDEQTTLIAHGLQLLKSAGSGEIHAFRSGSFAANRNTFEALRRNGIMLDASLNRCYEVSAPDLRKSHDFTTPFVVEGVTTYPLTVIKDGFGKDRPAQVGACGFNELQSGLLSAHHAGADDFLVLSHNFEMLKPGSSAPDWIVVKRFERLCEYLARHPQQFRVRGFDQDLRLTMPQVRSHTPTPRAGFLSTCQRYVEQILRRLN